MFCFKDIGENMTKYGKGPQKSCLGVLHHLPYFLKTGKKVLLYKSILHLIFRIPIFFFFFLRIWIF